jgi:iron complex outermembrane receptor protein
MQLKHQYTIALMMAISSANVVADTETKLFLDDLVVTGTRDETALSHLAGNTGKVAEAEIDLLNADHIEESLSRVSGVNIQRGNGAESLVALRSPVLTGPGAAGAFLFRYFRDFHVG